MTPLGLEEESYFLLLKNAVMVWSSIPGSLGPWLKHATH